MENWIKCTRYGGEEVDINLDKVAWIEPSGNRSKIIFVGGDTGPMEVMESLEQILGLRGVRD